MKRRKNQTIHILSFVIPYKIKLRNWTNIIVYKWKKDIVEVRKIGDVITTLKFVVSKDIINNA